MYKLVHSQIERVLITGASGLLGSAVVRLCESSQIDHVDATREACDIMDYRQTVQLLQDSNACTVIHCAAYVGGIQANAAKPYEFFSKNTMMLLNITNAAIHSGVRNLVLPNSNCSYPELASQPYKECDFLSGMPYSGNIGYAGSKISSLYAGLSVERQHGIRTYHPIPCSLYGPNDNFSQESSHFIPAAIRKLSDAAANGDSTVAFWGSGRPRREFMHADDAARGIFCMIQNELSGRLVNLAYGRDESISDVALLIAGQVGFTGNIKWDVAKPDGAMSKLLCTAIMDKYKWSPSIDLPSGIASTISWYKSNRHQIRL